MDRSIKFINYIRFYRLKNRLTQDELASQVGVTGQAISDLENCKYGPSAYTALMLCKVFDCSFHELFVFQDYFLVL